MKRRSYFASLLCSFLLISSTAAHAELDRQAIDDLDNVLPTIVVRSDFNPEEVEGINPIDDRIMDIVERNWRIHPVNSLGNSIRQTDPDVTTSYIPKSSYSDEFFEHLPTLTRTAIATQLLGSARYNYYARGHYEIYGISRALPVALPLGFFDIGLRGFLANKCNMFVAHVLAASGANIVVIPTFDQGEFRIPTVHDWRTLDELSPLSSVSGFRRLGPHEIPSSGDVVVYDKHIGIVAHGHENYVESAIRLMSIHASGSTGRVTFNSWPYSILGYEKQVMYFTDRR